MKNKSKFIQISCDGGAATGKSTGGKLISRKYRLKFLSSGLLYRYASFLLLKFKPKNKLKFLKIKFNNLNYKKLNKMNLHTQKISEHSAVIARVSGVRLILKKFQKDFSRKNRNCCIEGRDISTKILPHSDLKFFLSVAKYCCKKKIQRIKKITQKLNLKM